MDLGSKIIDNAAFSTGVVLKDIPQWTGVEATALMPTTDAVVMTMRQYREKLMETGADLRDPRWVRTVNFLIFVEHACLGMTGLKRDDKPVSDWKAELYRLMLEDRPTDLVGELPYDPKKTPNHPILSGQKIVSEGAANIFLILDNHWHDLAGVSVDKLEVAGKSLPGDTGNGEQPADGKSKKATSSPTEEKSDKPE